MMDVSYRDVAQVRAIWVREFGGVAKWLSVGVRWYECIKFFRCRVLGGESMCCAVVVLWSHITKLGVFFLHGKLVYQ